MQISTNIFDGTISRQVLLPYMLAIPHASVPTPWPLLLFLHGSGERGTDLANLTDRGLPKELTLGRQLPFLAVAPQCPPNTIWSLYLDALIALIEHLQAQYPVDSTRISVTGMSMGGTGAWHLAVTYPNRFAAVVPVCGDNVWYVGDPSQICAIRNVPVWVFHGAQDSVIPVSTSQTLVEALQSCGGNVRFTIYPDVGHNCWNEAYATSELYTWLSNQQQMQRVSD